jgi:hypothetical protein
MMAKVGVQVVGGSVGSVGFVESKMVGNHPFVVADMDLSINRVILYDVEVPKCAVPNSDVATCRVCIKVFI